MKSPLYVNLAVYDLAKTKAFYEALGLTINPQYSDDNAACYPIDDHVVVMLLKREYFQTFTDKHLADSRESSEVLLCLTCESREQVDETVRKALAAGGIAHRPAKDYGFMYTHSFQDPDGHVWELAHMAPSA